MKFSKSFIVAAGDIDEQGHVNNVAYVRWIQDIAIAHWRHAASEDMIAKFSWVVVRHEIDYKKQAFENEETQRQHGSANGRMSHASGLPRSIAEVIYW
jgi:acyl-CoA thioesterase FadM